MVLERDCLSLKPYDERIPEFDLTSLSSSRAKDSTADSNNNCMHRKRELITPNAIIRREKLANCVRAVGNEPKVRGFRAANAVDNTTAKRLRKLSNSSETIIKSYNNGWKCKLQRSRIQLKDIDKSTVKFHEKYRGALSGNRGIVRGRPLYKDISKGK